MTDQTPARPMKTPPEWAATYGITGLVAEEWQDHARVSGFGSSEIREDRPDWERPMTDRQFIRLLHGTWNPPADENVPKWKQRKYVDRTKKMPTFRVESEAVIDVLGEFRGWVDTTSVTQALAEPLGYAAPTHLPPNTKTLTVLRALAADGIVLEEGDATDLRRIPTSRASNGKKWMLRSVYDDLICDRELDEVEHGRRVEKLTGWVAGLDETLVPDLRYTHSKRLAVVGGEFDPALDSGTVTVPWAALERLIDLSSGDDRRPEGNAR